MNKKLAVAAAFASAALALPALAQTGVGVPTDNLQDTDTGGTVIPGELPATGGGGGANLR